MGSQRTFASPTWHRKTKRTRRERFLAEMDAVIPWDRLLALITPHYPKAGKGRQPAGLERMLRIYCLQQWFNLSDPAAEEALDEATPCAASCGWTWATTWSPMKARSCGFATSWRNTT